MTLVRRQMPKCACTHASTKHRDGFFACKVKSCACKGFTLTQTSRVIVSTLLTAASVKREEHDHA